MSKRICHIDLDGVLVSGHRASLEYHGVYLDDLPFGKSVYDTLNDQLGNESPAHNVDEDQFWAGFDDNFWFNLPKTPECGLILNWASSMFGCENVRIATRPTESSLSYSGKHMWVCENLPKWIWNNVILIRDKSVLARPGTLLIDDSYVNCFDFEEAGGIANFISRPWNGYQPFNFETLIESLNLAYSRVCQQEKKDQLSVIRECSEFRIVPNARINFSVLTHYPSTPPVNRKPPDDPQMIPR